MKKIFITLFVFTSLFTFSGSVANACSCIVPEPPTESLEKSTAVFSGLVTNLENDDYSRDFIPNPVEVTIEVSEIWKGLDQQEIVLETARDSATCGFNFEEGQEYLVYANGEEGDLSVSLCSRTSLLSNAQADLEELGQGIEPVINELPESENFTKNLLVVGVLFLIAILTLVFNKRREEE